MRPDSDEWALRLAEVVSQRATCLRRSVGCVLTNARNQVLATGYNGRAADLPHCNEVTGTGYITGNQEVLHYKQGCKGMVSSEGLVIAIKSGTNLDACEAIHGEQNALLQCRDVYAIHSCYVTHSPCITCVKLLMNTGCRRIVFRERYAHDEAARLLWGEQDGKQWIHLPRKIVNVDVRLP